LFTFSQPNDRQLEAILRNHQNAPFSYPRVGETQQGNIPKGYNIDHNRVKLGVGASVFMAGKEALQRWKMFQLGWLQVFPPNAEIRNNSVVAVVISHFGFWSVNLSRIVYVEESERRQRLFAFAYGTLEEHAETGEERFAVSCDPDDHSVWFDILAISKPRHLLAKVGYPFSRGLQRRFARDSLAAMVKAVAG
jgi:uncharacterized protein (UPF0548 family)